MKALVDEGYQSVSYQAVPFEDCATLCMRYGMI